MKITRLRIVFTVLTCAVVVVALFLVSMTNKAAADSDPIAQANVPIEQTGLPAHENNASKSLSVIGNSLSTSSFTTFFTFQGNGVFQGLRFNLANVNPNSRVFVTASEYSTDPTNRFIGQARIGVFNIAPFNGGFLAWVEISWGSPINVRFDVFVDP